MKAAIAHFDRATSVQAKVLFGVVFICIIIAGAMLITGYVTVNGWGGSASHHGRFALIVGIAIGCQLALALEVFGKPS